MEALYRRSGEINRLIGEVRNEIGNDTFIREKETLEKRYRQKKSEYHENERSIIDSRHKIDVTSKEVPELVLQIEAELTRYSGGQIRISDSGIPEEG